MKKLTRPTEPPACLDKFKHGRDDWRIAVTPEDKKLIWNKLDEMQGGFCAYCECKLKDTDKHIEHFRKRQDSPQLTYDWGNLFGSCNSPMRCGKYKDNKAGALAPYDFIKPDLDSLNKYCVFLSTGKVRAKSHSADQCFADFQRTDKTLQVFNLNDDSSLVGAREAAIRNVKPQVDELYSAKDDLTDAEWDSLLADELEEINGKEFQTALEHVWRYNLRY